MAGCAASIVAAPRGRSRLARALAGPVLAGLGAMAVLPGCSATQDVQQPVAYNHKIHVAQLEIPCTECHRGAEAADHATLPDREVCLQCHEPDSPLGESAAEAHLLELLASGEPLRWHRVTRLREHVHFSHQRHVQAGRILCETCHGPVAERETPYQRPYINFNRELGMQRCIECHQQSGNPRAQVDCLLCHK